MLVSTLRMLGAALAAWWNDNAVRLGASVAFYTLFAIAPILIVAMAIAGTVFGPEAVRGEIVGQIDGLVGVEGGKAVQALLQGAANPRDNLLAAVIGATTFLLAACGAFLELQAAFNAIWRVAPSAEGQVKEFLLARLRSFGLVVAIGFLLMVSLGVSAAMAAIGGWLGQWAPEVSAFPQIMSALLSLAVTTALFAMLFKFLPDVVLSWSDVLRGAIVTAVLFTAGKEVIGLYLGQSSVASSYGAAGSVIVLLLWVYYSSQIVLIGAEFTRLHANRDRGTVPTEVFAEAVGPPPGSVEASEPVA